MAVVLTTRKPKCLNFILARRPSSRSFLQRLIATSHRYQPRLAIEILTKGGNAVRCGDELPVAVRVSSTLDDSILGLGLALYAPKAGKVKGN